MPNIRVYTTINDRNEPVLIASPQRVFRDPDLAYWRALQDERSRIEGAHVALADLGERITELHRCLLAAGTRQVNAREILEGVGL